MKFTPTKRGSRKSFRHAEGGGRKKFWGSLNAVVLAILKGGGEKRFHSLKGGHEMFYCLEGGRSKKFQTHDFPAQPAQPTQPPNPLLMTIPLHTCGWVSVVFFK